MKKENPKNFSLSVLLAGVLGCIAVAFLIYFLITGTNKHSGDDNSGNDSRLDLSSENISYLAQVGHMDSITDDEATTIKSDVQENITEAMDNLTLEVNTDYTVSNLNDIEAGVRLDSINVTVTAVSSSSKVKGDTVVTLNGQEDISDRGTTDADLATINVPTNQEDSLSALTAQILILTIQTNVSQILSEGQLTSEGTDYQINGLDLITAGAAFTDYSDQITVSAITSSTKLTGSFTITLQLSDD